MPLFCYVYPEGQATPYFEVLSEVETSALRRAAQLMAERPDAVRAELWDGERLVHTLERAEA